MAAARPRCPGPGAWWRPSHRRSACREQASVLSASLTMSARPSGPAMACGPVGQLDRLLMLVVDHPQRGEAGVGRGQLGAWAQRFEQRYRGRGRGVALAAPARRVQRAREPAQRVALAQLVTFLAPQGEGALAGLDRVLHAVQQRGLVAERVVQAGGVAGPGPVGEPQRPLVLRGRLAVRAQLRGAAARRRGRSAAPPARPPRLRRGRPSARRRHRRTGPGRPGCGRG